MKKISLGMACFMLFSIVLFSSCSKEGPAGAAGAAGTPGAAGPAGPAGATGAAGAPGVTNVMYSDWLDVTFTVDTVRNTNGTIDTVGLGFYGLIPAPKLTVDMLNKGEIKVYLNLGTALNPSVVPIPYFDGGILINPVYFVNNIELDSNVPVSSTTNAAGAKTQQYRYLLIPGATTARMANKIDLNDYKQVKDFFNMPD